MVAIVAGGGLGLNTSSASILGSAGLSGAPGLGRSPERVYVNAVTGNLVIQGSDESLVGRGPDAIGLRTYNSQGQLVDDNQDNWTPGLARRVWLSAGVANTAGSTATRRDEDGSERVFNWDAAKGLYLSTDGVGAHDTLAHNPASGEWNYTDRSSRIVETYGSGGKLTDITDATGNRLTVSYNGTLVSAVTTAAGETSYYDYNASNQLIQIRTVTRSSAAAVPDRTHTRVRYAYDTSNRLASVTVDLSPEDNAISDGDTFTTEYTYEGASKRVSSILQSDGAAIGFEYEQAGSTYRLKGVTNDSGDVLTLTYDTANRRTILRDALGQDTVYAYDSANRLEQISTNLGNGATASTSYAYNANGDVERITDGEGRHVQMDYDDWGNLVHQRDQLGNVVVRTYTSGLQLLTQTVATTGEPVSTTAASRYAYDAVGRNLRFEVSPEGRVTEHRYDALGQLMATIQYAGALYPVSVLASDAAPSESALAAWAAAQDLTRTERTDYQHDWRGKLSQMTSYANVDAAGNGLLDGGQAVTRYVYDPAGQLLHTYSPKNEPTHYTYDGLGRLLSTTNALNQISVNMYDDASRQVRTTASNGLLSVSLHDKSGRLVSVQQSGNHSGLNFGESRNYYDANSQLRMTRDATGAQQWWFYDPAGRKVGMVNALGQLQEYVYDRSGKLAQTVDYATLVDTAPLVDGAGNPVMLNLASVRPLANAADRKQWNTYDNAGRLAKTVSALGEVTEYSYDAAGRTVATRRYASTVATASLGAVLTPAAINPPASAADQLQRSFYGHDGQLLATLDGAGGLVEYRYDAAGRATTRISRVTPSPTAQQATGTLAQVTPADNPGDARTLTFYNARGQVVAELDALKYLTEKVYDANGNLSKVLRYPTQPVSGNLNPGTGLGTIRANAGAVLEQSAYSYDPVNRQLTQRVDPNGLDIQTTYTYDDANNLLTTTDSKGVLTQTRFDELGRTQTVTVDAGSGGLALRTQNTYDNAGRLISVIDANGATRRYAYDAAGRKRFEIDAEGAVTEYRHDAMGLVTSTLQYECRLEIAGNPTEAQMVQATSSFTTRFDVDLSGFTGQGGVWEAGKLKMISRPEAGGTWADVDSPRQRALGSAFKFDLTPNQMQQDLHVGIVGDSSTGTYNRFAVLLRSTGRVGIQVGDARGNWNLFDLGTYTAGTTYTVEMVTEGSGATVYFYAKGQTRAQGYTYTAADGTFNWAQVRLWSTANRSPGLTVETTAFIDNVEESAPASRTTRYVYDVAGRKRFELDAEGAVTEYRHDAMGLVTSTLQYERRLEIAGNPTEAQMVQATSSFTTRFDADLSGFTGQGGVWEAGQLKMISRPEAGGTWADVDSPRQRALGSAFKFDLTPNQMQQDLHVGIVGDSSSGIYNRFAVLLRSTGRVGIQVGDAQGNWNLFDLGTYTAGTTYTVEMVTEGSGATVYFHAKGQTRAQGYAYTAADGTFNWAQVRLWSTAKRSPDLTVETTAFIDNVEESAPAARITRYAYDAAGRLRFTVDPLGYGTERQYDAAGNLINETRYANQILGNLVDNPSANTGASSGWTGATAVDAAPTGLNPDGKVFMQADRDSYGSAWFAVNEGDRFNLSMQVIRAAIVDGRSPYPMRIGLAYSVDGSSAINWVASDSALVGKDGIQSLAGQLQIPSGVRFARAWVQIDGPWGSTGKWYFDNVNVSRVGVLDANRVQALDGAADRLDTLSRWVSRSADDRTTRYTYDAAGRRRFELDAEGAVTEYRYDGIGQVTSTLQYERRLNIAGSPTEAQMVQATSSFSTNFDAGLSGFSGSGGVWEAGRLQMISRPEAGGTWADVNSPRQMALGSAFKFDLTPNQMQQDLHVGIVGDSSSGVYNRFAVLLRSTGRVGIQVGDAQGNWNLFDLGTYTAGTTYTVEMVTEGAGATVYFHVKGQTRAQGYAYTAADGTFNWAQVRLWSTAKRSPNLTAETTAFIDNVDEFAPEARITRYVYDDAGRRVYQQDALGGVIRYRYDAVGRLIGQIGFANRIATTTPLTVAAFEAAVGVGSPLDRTVRYVHDQAGRRVYEQDALGGVTKYRYDALGQLVGQVALANRIATSTEQSVAAFDAAVGAGSPLDRTTRYVYDQEGRRVYEQDALGGVTRNRYDALGRLIEQVAFATRIATSTAQTVTAFDAAVGAGSPQDRPTRYVYNAAGQVRFTVNALGGVVETMYDALGRVARTIAHDTDAAPVAYASITDASAPDEVRALLPASTLSARETVYTYTATGQVRHTAQSFQLEGGVKRFAVVENQYDGFGLLRSTRNYAGTVRLQDLPGVVNAADLATRLASVQDPAADRINRYVYDAAGRKRFELDAVGAVTEHRYGAAGQVTSTRQYEGRLSIAGNPTEAQMVEATSSFSTNFDNGLAGFGGEGGVWDSGRLKMVSRQAPTSSWPAVSSPRKMAVGSSFKLDVTPNQLQQDLHVGIEGNSSTGNYNRLLVLLTADGRLGAQFASKGGALTYANMGVYTPGTTYTLEIVTSNSGGSLHFYVKGQTRAQGYAYTAADGQFDWADLNLFAIAPRSPWFTGETTAYIDNVEESAPTTRTTRYVYDQDGRRLYQQDAVGGVTKYRYDALGLLIGQVAFANRIATTTELSVAAFDAAIGAGSSQDHTTRYVYDQTGQRVYEQDALGAVTRYRYDALDRLTEQVKFATRIATTTELSVAAFDAAIGAGSTLDRTTRYVYDQDGRRVYEQDSLGGVTRYIYSAFGQVITQVTFANRIATTTAPTVAAFDDAIGAGSSLDRATRYVYDQSGLRVYEQDALGGVTRYRYDLHGGLIEQVAFASRIATTTALTVAAFEAAIGAGSSQDRTTRHVYDAAGRRTHSVDAAGSVTQYEYDTAGQLVIERKLANQAPSGSAVKIKNADGYPYHAIYKGLGTFRGGDTVTATVRFKAPAGWRGMMFLGDNGGPNPYDNSVEEQKTGDGGWQTITLTHTMSHDDIMSVVIYNPVGSPDPDAGVVYDNIRVSSATQGMVLSEDFEGFDAAARGWSITSTTIESVQVNTLGIGTQAQFAAFLPSLLDPARDRTTRYVYDQEGCRLYQQDALGSVIKYSYDALGQLAGQVQFSTRIATNTALTVAAFDAAIGTGSPMDRATRYVYDQAGRRVYQQDALGGVTKVRYDALGRLIEQVEFATRIATTTALTVAAFDAAIGAGSALDRPTRYVYDTAGQLRFKVDALGGVVETQYDSFGRVARTIAHDTNAAPVAYSSITDASTPEAVRALLPASTLSARETVYTYNAAGQVLHTAQSFKLEGTVKRFAVAENEYDVFGRVEARRSYAGAVALQDLAGVVSSVDMTLRVAAVQDPVNDRVERFEYDKQDRVVKTTDGEGYTEEFEYDAFGDKFRYVNKNLAVFGYTYDSLGRLVSERGPAVDIATVTSIAGSLQVNVQNQQIIETRYDYDSAGNLTSRTEAFGRTDEQRTTRYDYDALGRQVRTWFSEVGVYDEANDIRVGDNANGVNGTAITVKEVDSELYTETVYDAFGQAVAGRDVRGGHSYKTYDQLGRVVYEVDTNHAVTKHVYSSLVGQYSGVLRAAATADFTDTLSANAGGSLVSAADIAMAAAGARGVYTFLNQLGRVKSTQDLGAGALSYDGASGQSGQWLRSTQYSYTVFGDLASKSVQLDGSNPSNASRLSREFYAYDLSGALVYSVDAEGGVTSLERDAFGQITTTTEYATKIDPANPGALVASISAANTLVSDIGHDRVTTTTYNRRGEATLVGNTSRLGAERTGTNTLTARAQHLYTYNAYDGVGNLTKTYSQTITVATGQVYEGAATWNYYDKLGRLVDTVTTTNASTDVGAATTHRYDALGNLVQSTRWANARSANQAPSVNPDNDQNTTTRFDLLGRTVQVQDARGNSSFSSYDAAGNVAKQWQPYADGEGTRNAVRYYSYDKVGRQLSTTVLIQRQRLDALTAASYSTESVAYNTFGEAERTQRNGVTIQQNSYDAGGRMWKSTAGGTTRLYWYDLQDKVTAVFSSSASASGISLAGFSYTQLTNMASLSPTAVTRTNTRYDRLGRATGQATSAVTRSNGSTTTTEASQVLDRWGNTITVARNGTERMKYRYDGGNRVVSETLMGVDVWHANGTSTPNASVEKRMFYDAWGRMIGNIDANGNANAAAYDSLGHLSAEYRADQTAVGYGYDLLGRRTFRYEPSIDRTTEYKYDRADQLERSEVKGLDGQNKADLTRYEYDALGRVVKEVSGQEAAVWGVERLYDYDARGLLWRSRRGPDFVVATYKHDVAGQKIEEVDANNLKSTWTYNPATGQLASRVDLGGAAYSYAYNDAGLLRQQTNRIVPISGATRQDLAYTYYDDGRLRSVGDSFRNSFTTYDYDPDGNRTREVFTEQGVTYRDQNIAYDRQGRMTSVVDYAAGINPRTDGSKLFEISIGYDAVGNRRRAVSGTWGQQFSSASLVWSSRTQWFTYDAMNRWRGEGTSVLNGVIQETQYTTYDAGGRAANWVQVIGSGTPAAYTLTTSHQYDRFDRIVKETASRTGSGYGPNATLAYSPRESRAIDYRNGERIEVNHVYGGDEETRVGELYTTTRYTAGGQTQSVLNQQEALAKTYTVTEWRSIAPSEPPEPVEVTRRTTAFAIQTAGEQTFEYDRVGNLAKLVANGYTRINADANQSNPDQLKRLRWASQSVYATSYYLLDGYKERGQRLTGSQWAEGNSITNGATAFLPTQSRLGYDANGQLTQISRQLSNGSYQHTWLVTDNSGKIVQNRFDTNSVVWGNVWSLVFIPSDIAWEWVELPQADQDFLHQRWLPADNPNPVPQSATPISAYAPPSHITALPDLPGFANSTQWSKQSNLFAVDQQLGTYSHNVSGSYTGAWGFINIGARQAYSLQDQSVQYHTAALGDTVESLAQRYYGDPALWYVIAEANNLGASPEAAPAAGMAVKIPKVVRNTNTATSFAVYEPASIIGETSPEVQLPPPPPVGKDRCGALSQIIAVVVAVAVTALTGYPPAGAAAGDAARQYSAAAFNGRLDERDFLRRGLLLPVRLMAMNLLDPTGLSTARYLYKNRHHPPGFTGENRYDYKSTLVAVAASYVSGQVGPNPVYRDSRRCQHP